MYVCMYVYVYIIIYWTVSSPTQIFFELNLKNDWNLSLFILFYIILFLLLFLLSH